MYKARVKMKQHWLYLKIFTALFVVSEILPVESRKISVWGPGLEPDKIVMPARYFFIKYEPQNNESIPLNIQDKFNIVVEGDTHQKKHCRIWSNILDRKDGSFIARYKVYETCTSITINVKYENQHVADSPYKISNIVNAETCYCPKDNITELLHNWHCETVPAQIPKSFKIFKSINWDKLRNKVIKQFDKPHSVSLCHYVVKENEIYRKCYGKHVGFNMFSDSILLSLTRKVKLPDLEVFVNLGDWPLTTKNLDEIYPIFSWCGSTDSNDVIMPTYEITEASLENMGRVTLDMLSVQGNVNSKFEEREPKLFWRGRDSSRERLNLISIARKHPDMFNVSLTNFFFFRDEEHIYGPKAEHVSFFRFFDYKYQLAIDGTVAPYRMPFLLGGGSLIFKPHSKYFEHFYNDLEPYTHYIPVKSDLSDLVEKISWAEKNTAKAKAIAQNGQQFANDNLLPQHIFCYYLHLLNYFSTIVTSDVNVLDDMEIVRQNKIPCDCIDSSKISKDEL